MESNFKCQGHLSLCRHNTFRSVRFNFSLPSKLGVSYSDLISTSQQKNNVSMKDQASDILVNLSYDKILLIKVTSSLLQKPWCFPMTNLWLNRCTKGSKSPNKWDTKGRTKLKSERLVNHQYEESETEMTFTISPLRMNTLIWINLQPRKSQNKAGHIWDISLLRRERSPWCSP